MRQTAPAHPIYLCILLIAAFLPYVWIGVAKYSGERYNDRMPCDWLARQESALVRRGHAAHLNAFEAFMPLAAAT